MKNTLRIFIVAGCAAAVVLVLLPAPASAGIWDGISCNTEGNPNFGNPCTFCEGMKLAVNIVDFLGKMAIVITAGLIVYGGVMMMISAGNQGRFSAGKGIMTAAVTGLIITLLAWIIINTILVFLVKTPDDKKDAIFEEGASWFDFKCKSY